MITKDDVTVTEIDARQHPQYMDHETVYKIHAEAAGITAYVGVHSTALGPGLGGIRYQYYKDDYAALNDVLRLSEAMTWKNAAGALNHGGGKSVVMAPEGSRKPPKDTLDVLAHGLNKINENGAVYFGAEDMNIDEEALDYIAQTAPWIKGVTSDDETVVSGSPSPLTAIGVYECVKVAAKFKLGKDTLEGVRISMQGLGSVGGSLAEKLSRDGAILIGCDTADEALTSLAAKGVDVQRVGLDEIYDAPADIFAPNAIGGTLTDENIQRLKAAGVQIVCGAANNQQADQKTGAQSKLMHELGILYCPDYIVNAAGVIWVAMVGENAAQVREDIRTGVPRRFAEVLEIHKNNPDRDMASIASEYARARVEAAQKSHEHSNGDLKSA